MLLALNEGLSVTHFAEQGQSFVENGNRVRVFAVLLVEGGLVVVDLVLLLVEDLDGVVELALLFA